MSCFQVSDNQISAVVRFACVNDVRVHGRGGNPAVYLPGMEQEICNLLAHTNMKSIDARYQSTTETAGAIYNSDARRLSPVEAIKAAQCIAYQCDEAPDFENSPAAEFLTRVQVAAISLLPGYKVAPWAFE